jgi:hypothetical protein
MISMRASGKMILSMDKGNILIEMVMYMRGNLFLVSCMDKVLTHLKMGTCI